MSAYKARAHDPERHWVFVGWNRELRSFFVQVLDVQVALMNDAIDRKMQEFTADDPEWHSLINALEYESVFSRGTVTHEILSVYRLGLALAPYGEFLPGQVRQLIRDKVLAPAPTVQDIGGAIREAARMCRGEET